MGFPPALMQQRIVGHVRRPDLSAAKQMDFGECVMPRAIPRTGYFGLVGDFSGQLFACPSGEGYDRRPLYLVVAF